MGKIYTYFFVVLCCLLGSLKTTGQVVSVTNPTNTTPNLAATYTSLANAITALNGITAISGPVVITLNPGNPQTTPAGGYSINFTATTTAVNNVTITGSGNTVTAFTPQVSGTLTDAIFKLIGVDYITIQGFVMQENPSNTTTTPGTNNMTEWGVALLLSSTTNGAQNNTIQNNTISLNRTYTNTFGIYSNTRHSATVIATEVFISNGTTAPNVSNRIYGNTISNVNMGIALIGSGVDAYMDRSNDIGGSSALTGNTLSNWGGAAAISGYIANSGTCYGILIKNQKAENVSYNTLTSASISGTAVSVRGIYKDFATSNPSGAFTSTISNNSISITNLFTSGLFQIIRSDGLAGTATGINIHINNNLILNNEMNGASSSSDMTGISNNLACSNIEINENIFRGNATSATTGTFTGIINSADVTGSVIINKNKIGDAIGNAITFNGGINTSVQGIVCSAIAPEARLSISGNNFQGFNYSVNTFAAHTFISYTHSPNSATVDSINSNTFTALTIRSNGNVNFISRGGIMANAAGAIEHCSNNAIVTSFAKSQASGIVSLFRTDGTSFPGNTMIQTGNNFSNINLTVGNITMAGWNNSEGSASGGPTKQISNNVFSNWSSVNASIIAIQSNNGGSNTTVSNNTITAISGLNQIIGISAVTGNNGTQQTYTGNTISSLTTVAGAGVFGMQVNGGTVTSFDVSQNTIHTLTSAANVASAGIRVTGGVTILVRKNKIYNISGTAANTGVLVYGIDITGANNTTHIISNNYIGDLKAPAANNINVVRGLNYAVNNSNGSVQFLYNTIYLNASSTGTNFGTSGVFVNGNATATTSQLILRNNIIVNESVANGTGLTVSYRRSSTAIASYSNLSNNNIFFAGTPSPANLIFHDGTNSDETLAAFKTRMATRDQQSYTELPPFLNSSNGALANYLHIDPTIPTQAESGAVAIAGYTDDYDGDVRQGNPGYSGTGTGPDIGADEFEGIILDLTPPVITYTLISSPTCTYTGMTLTGVLITDTTGIPLAGPNRPRIYYRKNAGSWFSQPGTNTSGTAKSSIWSFTINEADMGGVASADVVSYYIIAQDIAPAVNVGSYPAAGLAATSVNSVTTHPTTPNAYTLNYNFSGTYTVGVGGNFTTLTAAVAAYNNSCALSGPTIFELIDNAYPSETFPIAINNHVDASNTNTLTIRPSATATPLFTHAVNAVTINLNGARFIRIDGRQGGSGSGRFLTVTNTGGGITMQFINDAQNNIVRNCIIKGQRVSALSGTIVFSTAGAGSGNDNNTIDNNEINEAGGFSNNAIFSSGTNGQGNDNITISNNLISNNFNATNDSHGIYIHSSNAAFVTATDWTITNNRFFQTAERVFTGNVTIYGIRIVTGSGYTINNNVIGFEDANGNGTTKLIGNSVNLPGFPTSYSVAGVATQTRFIGIVGDFLLLGSTSSINGNTIGGIALYTGSTSVTVFGHLCGIYIEKGSVNIGNVSGNIIGATSGTSSIYLASTVTSGLFVGIRAASIGTSQISNNVIGAIMASGAVVTASGSIVAISLAGLCNYEVTNNQIGNTTADNLRIGFSTTGGFLSSTGALTANSSGVAATFRGIVCTATGNSVTITNNVLRGWAMSCNTVTLYGIETSGALTGFTPSVNINNNTLGTPSVNWINSIVDYVGFFYGMNITNTSATTTNIKDNNIQGNFFGTMSCNGGGLIRLSGATAANNIATISGNTFTNINIRFLLANLYFIYTNYTIASTGKLIIENNSTVGAFNGSGTASYYLISGLMNSSAGATVDITNNNFSNINAAVTSTSEFFGIYTFFNGGSCNLTITGNTMSNWTSGVGSITGIEISAMAGTANCTNNILNNFTTRGDVEGISISTPAITGTFNVVNNTVTNMVSNGAGGFIYGISRYLPTTANTTQANISKNILGGYSSTSPIGVLTGIHIDNGHVSSTLSVTGNKIYDIAGSTAGSRVYGINNYTPISGNITYSNNIIGDLRAPNSTVADRAVTGINILMANGTANVYYNSIHLNATGVSALFSSAAIYADVAAQLTLRNNIFSNTSVPGASGRTVTYWRSNTSLASYNASSNNNIFYAGIPSTQRLIFYDGTNSDEELDDYQTRVTPRDNLSVTGEPGFISTIGTDADFLHLTESGNCNASARGNNAGILIPADFDDDIRSTTDPFVTDIGADEFSKKNQWTGNVNTNWNNAGNWSEAVVPNTTEENVTISGLPANQPVISAGDTYQVASIIIGTGGTLTNRGNLKVSGGIYAPVSSVNNIQAGIVTGSVEMNGACSVPQTVSGNVFVSNSVNHFTANNHVIISAVPGENLNIAGTLSFGGASGKTLQTNDNATLLSSVHATANVADLTGNQVIGQLTVERFINTGFIADGRHPKSWQLLSAPTTGSSIFQSWQENGSVNPGFGAWITGTGSGFDAPSPFPALKFYNPATNDWVGETSTANPVNNGIGYMLFVRGDRTVTTFNGDPVPTILRSKGNIYQPSAPAPAVTVPAGLARTVGNPYASAIDLIYMRDNGLMSNLNNDVVVWDPLVYGGYGYGGYQTLASANDYEPTAGGTAYYPSGVPSPHIQSGQAFFVRSSGPAGSVSFTEACKENTNRLVHRVQPREAKRSYFRAGLRTSQGVICDGNAAIFGQAYRNIIDADDAIKMRNEGENFFISSCGKELSVEARTVIERTDTIFYQLTNLRRQPYQFSFAPKNFSDQQMEAVLVDRFLRTESVISMSDSSYISFSITDNPASARPDRFFVVFRKKRTTTPPFVLLSGKQAGQVEENLHAKPAISVYPNPVVDGVAQLSFEHLPAGNYQLKLIDAMGRIAGQQQVRHDGLKNRHSFSPGKNIPSGIYQLLITGPAGYEYTLQVMFK